MVVVQPTHSGTHWRRRPASYVFGAGIGFAARSAVIGNEQNRAQRSASPLFEIRAAGAGCRCVGTVAAGPVPGGAKPSPASRCQSGLIREWAILKVEKEENSH